MTIISEEGKKFYRHKKKFEVDVKSRDPVIRKRYFINESGNAL